MSPDSDQLSSPLFTPGRVLVFEDGDHLERRFVVSLNDYLYPARGGKVDEIRLTKKVLGATGRLGGWGRQMQPR